MPTYDSNDLALKRTFRQMSEVGGHSNGSFITKGNGTPRSSSLVSPTTLMQLAQQKFVASPVDCVFASEANDSPAVKRFKSTSIKAIEE